MAKQGIQWGTQRFQGNTQPNWHVDLTTDGTAGSRGYNANNVIYSRPNHPNAGENLEATDRGWERVVQYKDSNGNQRTKREVVVAQGGLANTLAYGTSGTELLADTTGGPHIVDIRWATANNTTGPGGGAGGEGMLYSTEDTVGLVVTFSEPVQMDESASVATGITVASTGGTPPTPLTLTSGNNTNKLTFTKDMTGTAMAAGDILSIVDDKTFIALGGATTLKALKSGTGFGRKGGGENANTPTASTHRSANVSSLGISGLLSTTNVQGDG
jgi:hypothetical protein